VVDTRDNIVKLEEKKLNCYRATGRFTKRSKLQIHGTACCWNVHTNISGKKLSHSKQGNYMRETDVSKFVGTLLEMLRNELFQRQ
jgi:hypothetical protein